MFRRQYSAAWAFANRHYRAIVRTYFVTLCMLNVYWWTPLSDAAPTPPPPPPVYCQTQVPTQGMHDVRWVLYYAHRATPDGLAAVPYTTEGTTTHNGPGTIQIRAEGHPVACEIYVDGALDIATGTKPALIFTDGFEGGDAENWGFASGRVDHDVEVIE